MFQLKSTKAASEAILRLISKIARDAKGSSSVLVCERIPGSKYGQWRRAGGRYDHGSPVAAPRIVTTA